MFNVLRQATRSSSSLRVAAARRSGAALSLTRTLPFVRTLITKRYTEDHETIAFDDTNGISVVCITDYAQSSLGDVVFVELPSVGTEVKKGEQIGAVESVKAASDIYAPVSGTVEAVNEGLASSPSLLNKSPEGDGWLCKIKVSNPTELDSLLTEEAYKAHCEDSAH